MDVLLYKEILGVLIDIYLSRLKTESYYLKKSYDEFGRVVTQIFLKKDTTGDGKFDSEEVIYELNQTIPDLENGYVLCNKGNQVGLGFPALRNVDANDVISALERTSDYISDGNGLIIDLDNDGSKDDIIFPLPFDVSGDGLPDFQIVVDDDDNGLPDVSPESPFYPIGSEGYQQIVDVYTDNVPALDKQFKNYTVTEALLFLIFIGSAIGVMAKIFKRRNM